MARDDKTRTIRSVDRAFEVLWALRRLDAATLTELKREVDLSKGALHTHLTTLEKHGFVEKNGFEYELGQQFLSFGEYVRNKSHLYRAAKGEVDELAVETGECVHLITEKDGKEMILYESFGDRAVAKEFFVENRQSMDRYLHYSAAGKAILSEYDEEEVDAILDEHGMPAATEHTITDREALKADLERTRERGYASNVEEDLLGLRSVGTPIFDGDGEVLGALSMTVPADRLSEVEFTEEMPQKVKEYGNIIEINLQTGGISV